MSDKEYVKILRDPTDLDIKGDASMKFKFELDNFQKHAINCISRDENVLVTAHTGSGKTVVAQYAIAHTIMKNRIDTERKHRIVYTSPIKALSNQKYKEFKEDFENKLTKELGYQIEIGIMTGDNKIKPDADCVIMTTEILRNALYEIGEKDKTKKETYLEDNFIDTIDCVIFDEVHYINDPDRGHVWEETLILLKENINLVMLSATIDKSEEFAGWLGRIKNRVINLIPTTHRVIPLEHYIYTDKRMYKILDQKENFLNKNYDEAYVSYKKMEKIKGVKGISEIALINEMVEYLIKKNLTQTIFFSFSRKNCEKYANMINRELVDHIERKEIEDTFNKYMHKYEEQYKSLGQYQLVKKLIVRGISFHHSGLIPILKEIIEIIFQRGLIKILFATETFAVGVNMPTRSIVYTEVEKFTGNKRRILTTAEYKQMSGRAGRRGLDLFGTVIILPIYEFPYRDDIKSMMLGSLPSIKSKFYLNYSFVLKIYQSNNSNLNDFLQSSLYYKDYLAYVDNIKLHLRELQDRYKLFEDEFRLIKSEEFDEYLYFERLENDLKDKGLMLNKKQIQEKKQLLKNVNSDILDRYREYLNIKIEIDETQLILDNLNVYMEREITKLLKFLNKYEYINQGQTIDLTNINITMKGILGAQINECNSIILTEMITRNIFDDLSAEEIVGLLSIFIEDVKYENPKRLVDIKQTVIKNRIEIIEKMIKEFRESEIELDISDNETYGYWNIYYDYVDVAYEWANGTSLREVFKILETYEGNFVKNMLKINNIATDLKSLTSIYGNLKIIPKLDQIEDLILRDIVTINSLYIS